MADQDQENRYQALSYTLLIVAILGPLFYWIGLLSRGISFFYIQFVKLIAAYVFLACSAGCAVWLILRRAGQSMRILAIVALVINIAGLGYAGRLWRADSSLLTQDTVWTPFNQGQVGIVIAPADDSAQSLAEARIVEETIRQMSAVTDLEPLVATRLVTNIATAQDARQIAQRMQALVVVWGTSEGSELVHTEHHVTALGAAQAVKSLEPAQLMLALTTMTTFSTADNRLSSENVIPPTAQQIIAPVALAFASLAINQPVFAASFFSTTLSARYLAEPATQQVQGYYGLALLLANRPDLARETIAKAQAPMQTASSALAAGNLALYEGDITGAEVAYLQARALDPRLVQAYCGLAIIESSRARLDRAQALYNQAIALEPTWGVIRLLQAQTYELRGDVSAAQGTYRQAEESIYPFEGLSELAAQRMQGLASAAPTPVPTATIQPTPSPMPIPGQRYHTVAKNETLAQIASLYGISEEDIITLNKLENRHVLYIGQVLVIPEE